MVFFVKGAFSSEFHFLCQLLGRSENTCLFDLVQRRTNDWQPVPHRSQTRYRIRVQWTSCLLTSVTQGLKYQCTRAPIGPLVTRLVHTDVAEDDSYERPAIMHKIKPRVWASQRPGDNDAGPNVLYYTPLASQFYSNLFSGYEEKRATRWQSQQ